MNYSWENRVSLYLATDTMNWLITFIWVLCALILTNVYECTLSIVQKFISNAHHNVFKKKTFSKCYDCCNTKEHGIISHSIGNRSRKNNNTSFNNIDIGTLIMCSVKFSKGGLSVQNCSQENKNVSLNDCSEVYVDLTFSSQVNRSFLCSAKCCIQLGYNFTSITHQLLLFFAVERIRHYIQLKC